MIEKERLKVRRIELEKERDLLEIKLRDNASQLAFITNLEKPFVANVSAYSGHYSMQFNTEQKARKKLNEYASKQYFKNGLNYGVYLYKWNEDGSKTLIESIPLGRKDFTPNI